MTPMTALDTLVSGGPARGPRVPGALGRAGHRLGPPQRAGALTMVPIHGPAHPGFAPPRSGLKLSRVTGYGRVELACTAGTGVAIVPLHIGYVQDRAQNHALCRSAFLAPGQKLLFEDACCVQETQGGYLAEADQWFFVLPGELRARALELRGVPGYAKLWNDISALNARYGLPRRGHLEQILSRKRPVLTQFRSRLELRPGQIGALFLVAGAFAGLELAPDPAYFAEVWPALVCFAYGVAAWHAEHRPAGADTGPGAEPGDGPAPLEADDLDGLRGALERDRAGRLARVADALTAVPDALREADLREEERYLDLRLSTVTAPGLAGQIVTDGDRTVYASLFAR